MDQWITGFIEKSGYLGVALLTILENLFPPIPSELIMPFAGFAAQRGELSLPLVIIAGTIGSVVGALPWYAAGRWIGEDRLMRLAAKHGRWLALTPRDVDKSEDWFRKHSSKAVLFGRLVPAVRTLISVPAGVARMAIPKFLLYSTIGSLIWMGGLAAVGYALGDQYERVARYMGAGEQRHRRDHRRGVPVSCGALEAGPVAPASPDAGRGRTGCAGPARMAAAIPEHGGPHFAFMCPCAQSE